MRFSEPSTIGPAMNDPTTESLGSQLILAVMVVFAVAISMFLAFDED